MRRRCASNAASSRTSNSSSVSPGRLNSSSGPVSASRSWRLRAEIDRAVAVIVPTGRTTRPAANHPSSAAATALSASIAHETARSRRSSALCWVTTSGRTSLAAGGPEPDGAGLRPELLRSGSARRSSRSARCRAAGTVLRTTSVSRAAAGTGQYQPGRAARTLAASARFRPLHACARREHLPRPDRSGQITQEMLAAAHARYAPSVQKAAYACVPSAGGAVTAAQIHDAIAHAG
jgi:hypothetical protein